MKTLIEIHALQNYAPSNLNRDESGAPKDAFFGGTQRARISSQCLKRSIRQFFGGLVAKGTLVQEDLATRSKRLLGALTERLVVLGRDPGEAAGKTRLAFTAMGLGLKEDGKSEALMFLGQREIATLANLIDKQWDSLLPAEVPEPAEGDGAEPKPKKTVKAKKKVATEADPEVRKALEQVFDGGKALDLALFGRFLADMPGKNRDAACQVAHALSTNAVEREFDFYTAVDDLQPEDASGADMMGTVEFTSACFYRYAVLDWAMLVENLQGDAALAAKGVAAFLEGFVNSEPTGKQNSFAAHNPPEFVAVTVRHGGAPRSLTNAFETAIRTKKGESLTRLSADHLVEKARALKAAYGGEDTTLVLNLVGADLDGFGRSVPSLAALVQEAVQAVRS